MCTIQFSMMAGVADNCSALGGTVLQKYPERAALSSLLTQAKLTLLSCNGAQIQKSDISAG